MRLLQAVATLCFAAASALGAEQVPGVVIDHQSASTRQYIGSPSIVIAPNGDSIATHDLFGPGSTSTTSAETKVFVSHDRGASWAQTASFHDQFWSNLFMDKGRIYLMGTSAEYGRIVIRTTPDNGRSWSEAHFLTQDSGYHTAPVPVVVHQGRIYRAFEYHPAGKWGHFQAFMMWAPAGSDLTDAANWSFSNRVGFPAGEQGDAWLEGNAVVAPDGAIVDVLRVNDQQRAAILKLTGNTLALERFVDFPGGATKFSIRYDPVSRLYWALANPALPGEAQAVSAPAHVRNTLALISSPDLTHWTARTIVFHHPDAKRHAFQYVDWQFDGQDIVLVSRTAFDDTEGGAHSFHDANYMTFYRIREFRKLGTVPLTGSPFATAEVVTEKQMEKWTAATAAEAAERPDNLSTQPIGRYGNHTTMLTTRLKTGEAEQHRSWCDIFVVVAGEASLVSGGRLENPRTVAAGEQRGTGIVDGVPQDLVAGSIVHIDPHIPHQLVVPQGKSITYFVVKVKSAGAARGKEG